MSVAVRAKASLARRLYSNRILHNHGKLIPPASKKEFKWIDKEYGMSANISTFAPLQKSAEPMRSTSIYEETKSTNFDSQKRLSKSVANHKFKPPLPFLLADIGEGISEVELLKWFVHPGDVVSQFDRICEVQSDKASVEITSRFDGKVESLCGNNGDMMMVGEPLLYISVENDTSAKICGEEEENILEKAINTVDDDSNQLKRHSAERNYSNYSSRSERKSCSLDRELKITSTKVITSPAVRKLGKENNIDLTRVQGTGPSGRILKADILKVLNKNNIEVSSDISFDDNNSSKENDHKSNKISLTPNTHACQETNTIPIRGFHRLMAKSMTASLEVPHMVYADEVNMDSLTDVRDLLRPIAKESGVKLSYLPFFIKAASLALNVYPMINATIDANALNMTYHKDHNIGVAVDTPKGLAVPVVRGCQNLSVLEIGKELNRLHSLAEDSKLSEEDIANSTFTLSNIGAIGGTYMSPVVLPPQVAIGAMGKIKRLPRFVSDDSEEVRATRIMPISWGGDHRAIDGATMARFSNLWKSYCENPASMIIAMR